LSAFLTSHGFRLARREDMDEWWTDDRSEIGFSAQPTGERTCDVEVIHDTGFE
jgi:hypothetical protein